MQLNGIIKKTLLILILLTSVVKAESLININLNENDIEFSLDNDSRYSNNTKIYQSLGFMKAENEYERTNSMVEGEVLVLGLTSIPGFSVGMGIKGCATRINKEDAPYGEDKNAAALGIKVKALYTLPVMVKSYITASYVYAPDSLTFSDIENYYESRAELDVEIIDGGMVYLGVRDIELDFINEQKSYTFNDAMYFGIKFVF